MWLHSGRHLCLARSETALRLAHGRHSAYFVVSKLLRAPSLITVECVLIMLGGLFTSRPRHEDDYGMTFSICAQSV